MSAEKIVLRYDNLALAPGRAPLSGVIRAGEIAGVAGLEGHGHEQFLLALAGLASGREAAITVETPDRGSIRYRDHYEAARHGVVYLPRDRRATGIFPVLSVLDNFAIPAMPRFSIAGILNRNGLVTGHGNRWTRERVTSLRSHHRIPVYGPAEDGIEPWLNLSRAARLRSRPRRFGFGRLPCSQSKP